MSRRKAVYLTGETWDKIERLKKKSAMYGAMKKEPMVNILVIKGIESAESGLRDEDE